MIAFLSLTYIFQDEYLTMGTTDPVLGMHISITDKIPKAIPKTALVASTNTNLFSFGNLEIWKSIVL